MTDQTTLDRLIADADADLQAALRWAATADLHAPLAMKVKDQERIDRARIELDALRELVAEYPTTRSTTMTPTIRAKIQASRERMTKVLHALHAERDARCTTWEPYSIPAYGGERMAGIGCREHDIFISSDE